MKRRRHHNNKGLRQIKRGKTYAQVKRMAKRLGLRMKWSTRTDGMSEFSGEARECRGRVLVLLTAPVTPTSGPLNMTEVRA